MRNLSHKLDERTPAKLVEGATVQGWKEALNQLAIAYPDRITIQ